MSNLVAKALPNCTLGDSHSPTEYVGRRIVAASIDEGECTLRFENGVSIKILDAGQQCCEDRFMRTDDDIQSLVGHELRRIDSKDGPFDSDRDADTCFVEIGTDVGFVTITNYNIHNGYYGGFAITIFEF